jgi:hypothetical protein
MIRTSKHLRTQRHIKGFRALRAATGCTVLRHERDRRVLAEDARNFRIRLGVGGGIAGHSTLAQRLEARHRRLRHGQRALQPLHRQTGGTC